MSSTILFDFSRCLPFSLSAMDNGRQMFEQKPEREIKKSCIKRKPFRDRFVAKWTTIYLTVQTTSVVDGQCSWSIKPISQNVSVSNPMKNVPHTRTRTRAQKWKRNPIHSHEPQPATEKKKLPTDIKINQFLKTNEGNNNSEKKTQKYKIEKSTRKNNRKNISETFSSRCEYMDWTLNRTNVEREWIERMNEKIASDDCDKSFPLVVSL